ncbi:DUF2637 domain-containing protein [Amycolatopsis cihanbeyliensis]|uniref:DUF2637 domain-containing protein n=1 Tax=Amycolatopsis cihanbeyliensis TaxID=1128664 RepID=UPI001FE75941|nr:DUF2637 domain-containing protein [Amycolatopsis cihanbeyliensis]
MTVIRVVVTVVLGGIGAAAGFKHTHDWAVHHGQTGWLAWADAVVIEGMAVVAGFEIHRDRAQPGPHRPVTFPMVVLVVAFGIQMAAQVALAEPTPAGWLLAAMPALGFLVVVKLLMRRATHHTTPATPANREPEPAPTGETTPAAPVTVPRLRLPAEIADKVADVVADCRRDGREPTTSDIRAATRVSETFAGQILATLTSNNGHPHS